MGTLSKAVLFLVIGLLVLTLFVPNLRQIFTRLTASSETVSVPSSDSGSAGNAAEPRELEIVTLLGFDAIPAILRPEFVPAAEAEAWMAPDEQVLGLSINGDHRAYSVRMLSRHEIVNDVVGGIPVAVTW